MLLLGIAWIVGVTQAKKIALDQLVVRIKISTDHDADSSLGVDWFGVPLETSPSAHGPFHSQKHFLMLHSDGLLDTS